jgi:hypothetical protein
MNFAHPNLKPTLRRLSAWLKVVSAIVQLLVVSSKQLLAKLTKFIAHGSVTKLIHKNGISISSSKIGVPFLVLPFSFKFSSYNT